jgi:hypothetical protein
VTDLERVIKAAQELIVAMNNSTACRKAEKDVFSAKVRLKQEIIKAKWDLKSK